MKLMRNREVQRLLLLCLLGTALIAAAGFCAGIVPGALALAGGLVLSGGVMGVTLRRYRAIAQLTPQPGLALIDGNRSTGITVPSRCVVGGDGKCADIAAASVLAKVTRDRYMRDMAQTYPQYGFENHKGYGTAAHYAAIREYGPCPIHRPSFLKKMH